MAEQVEKTDGSGLRTCVAHKDLPIEFLTTYSES